MTERRKLQILLILIPRRCAMPQRPPVTAGGGDEVILPISPRRYTVQYVSDRRYSTYVGEMNILAITVSIPSYESLYCEVAV